MIKGIIFDFGGVIIKSTENLIYQDLADEFKTNIDEISKAMNEIVVDYQKGNMSNESLMNFLYEKFGTKPNKQINDLLTLSYGANGYFDKNIELVRRLKGNGYLVACLSNTIFPHSEYNKKNKNYDIFDFAALSCDIGMRKPDKEIYEYVLKNLKLKPDEVIFTDDKLEFVTAAEKTGIAGIKFESEEKLKIELEEMGVKTNLA